MKLSVPLFIVAAIAVPTIIAANDSGNILVEDVNAVIDNPSDNGNLRGADLDMESQGHRGLCEYSGNKCLEKIVNGFEWESGDYCGHYPWGCQSDCCKLCPHGWTHYWFSGSYCN